MNEDLEFIRISKYLKEPSNETEELVFSLFILFKNIENIKKISINKKYNKKTLIINYKYYCKNSKVVEIEISSENITTDKFNILLCMINDFNNHVDNIRLTNSSIKDEVDNILKSEH